MVRADKKCGRTDGRNGRTDDAKTISLRLCRGIKIAIQFCSKDLFLLKKSRYYQYVYLEITVLCSQQGSNYFLLVQSRHIPKGNDVQ